MKKPLFLILSLLLYNFLFSQIDSVSKRRLSLNVEVGYLTSMFIEHHTGNRFNINRSIFPYGKLAFSKDKLTCFFNYKSYYEYNPTGSTKENPVIADSNYMIERQYTVIDLGFSYNFHIKKLGLFIEPALLLSRRPTGYESITAVPILRRYPIISYHYIKYFYNSYGLGAGINLRKHFYKRFYLSFEAHYNHFFESKKGSTNYAQVTPYQVNRNMITPILKLGYQINLVRNKRN